MTFHLQRKDVTDDVDVAALFVVKIHQRHGDEPVYIEKLFTLSEVSHKRTSSHKPEKGGGSYKIGVYIPKK